MEIKVKKVYEKEGKHSCKTSLFEAEKVTHEKVYFDNKEDFIDKYNEKSKGLEGCVVGVPEGYWFNVKIEGAEEDYFIFIQYELNEGKIQFIVVMNRIIYITNKGQTIDMVE